MMTAREMIFAVAAIKSGNFEPSQKQAKKRQPLGINGGLHPMAENCSRLIFTVFCRY
jgi:hypothetical protein